MAENAPQAKYRKDYRQPDYWIDTIDLTFELDDTSTRVVAVTEFRRNGDHDRDLILDGEGLTLVSVQLNDRSLGADDYQLEAGTLRLSHAPDRFTLTIETDINPQANSSLQGLYKSGGAFCTQCEAEGFRNITYFLDRPDVMAVYTTKVIAPTAYPQLLANGNRVAEGQLADGRHWVQWHDPHPKPSYLFALVAGDFDCLEGSFTTASARDVKLQVFVDKGNLNRAEHALASLVKSMDWEEKVFGREYDLDIYMIVAVDFFNMGAMENKGLNIFNSKYVLADPATATDRDYQAIEAVIGHEYFHNWTGNRVTCRDWFQLSLKEGLTVFRDQQFSADMGSRAINRIDAVRVIRTAQFAEDAGPMAHPIRPDKVIEMNNFYTVTVYNKGAEVIRMMHTLLGEEGFRQGMDCYFARHDGQAVTCDDFVQAMEDASGVDLGQFRRWYSQSGTPRLTIDDSYDPDQQLYTLRVEQQTPATADQAEKLPLHIPLSISLLDPAGQAIPLQYRGQSIHHVLDVREASQQYVFDQVSQRPTPALLQNFSAPVRIDYPYQGEQLAHLLAHADDPFCRWDAAQTLYNQFILARAEAAKQGNPVPVPQSLVNALRGALALASHDPALLAEILTLPSEATLAELQAEIDVDGLHEARLFLKQAIAVALASELNRLYLAHHSTQGYSLDQAAIAKRRLAGVCLSYLAAEDPAAEELVSTQFSQASNMTDTLAALTAAVHNDLPSANKLLASFEQQWQHDPLVMDKWFAIQGTAPQEATLDRVKILMAHVAFTIENPNRVHALIGSFVHGNPALFHRRDGDGYQFLADIVIQLNSVNPQTAARLVTPLTRWKRFDSARQQLMKAQLERIMATPDLAKDLFEILERSLA